MQHTFSGIWFVENKMKHRTETYNFKNYFDLNFVP